MSISIIRKYKKPIMFTQFSSTGIHIDPILHTFEEMCPFCQTAKICDAGKHTFIIDNSKEITQ